MKSYFSEATEAIVSGDPMNSDYTGKGREYLGSIIKELGATCQ